MSNPCYINFRNNEAENLLTSDFPLNYVFSSENSKSVNFIVLFKGIFLKNKIKNCFNAKASITLNLEDLDNISIKSFNVYEIFCSNGMLDKQVIQKYSLQKANLFSCFSKEFENDNESEIYELLELLLSKTSVSSIKDDSTEEIKLVFNMKLSQSENDFSFSSLSVKITERDVIKALLPKNVLSPKNILNNDIYIHIVIIIVLISCYITTKGTNLLSNIESYFNYVFNKFRIQKNINN